MSDLLAATGWIGEHPVTGRDVAHLLLYPATDLDPGTALKVAALAELLSMADRDAAGDPPWIDAQVNLAGAGEIEISGEAASLPDGAEWRQVAADCGYAVVSLTGSPMSAPTLDTIDDLVYSEEPLWVARVRVTLEKSTPNATTEPQERKR